MKTYLIKLVNLAEYQFDWILQYKTGASLEKGTGTIADIPQMKASASIVLVLPAETTVFHQVDKPAGKLTTITKATPYLLEDFLIEPPENYFFSINKMDMDHLSIVSIQKKILQDIVTPWQQHHHTISAIIPEIITYPSYENAWTVKIDNKIAKIKMSPHFGVFCDIDNLPLLLENAVLPEKWIVQSDNTRSYLKSYPIKIEYVDALEKSLIDNPTFNLVNHMKSVSPWHQKTIASAASLIACICILFIVNLGIEHYQLTNQRQALSVKIAALYKNIFPDSTEVTSPKLRIERKLQEHSLTGAHHLSLLILEKVSLANEKNNDIHLNRLRYENKKLNISFLVPSSQSYQDFLTTLSSHGLVVTENSFTQQENQFIANINVEYKS